MKFSFKSPSIYSNSSIQEELKFHRYLSDNLVVSLFSALYRLTTGSMSRSLSRDRSDGIDHGFESYLNTFRTIFEMNMIENGLEDPVLSEIVLGILTNVPEVREDQLEFYNAYMHTNEKE